MLRVSALCLFALSSLWAAAQAGEAPRPPHEIEQRAQHGDPDAQVELGLWLVRHDDAKGGVSWIATAARSGQRLGQALYAQAFDKGIGVVKDRDEALKWFQTSVSDAGCHACRILFGAWLLNNRHCEMAKKYFQETLRTIPGPANYGLGLIYAIGCAGKKDYVLSYVNIRKACDAGYTEAYDALSDLFLNGRGVEQDLVKGVALALVAGADNHSRKPQLRMNRQQIEAAHALAQSIRAEGCAALDR